MLKERFGKEIRDLAVMGISVEAGMPICGGVGKLAFEPTKTGMVTLGSKEQIFSPKDIPEDCGNRIQVGEIHTHVAERRTKISEKGESQLSINDLFSAKRAGLDFTCNVRKGKLRCADLTGVSKATYEQTKEESKLKDDLYSAWKEGYGREQTSEKLPKSWFKLADSIRKRMPQCEVNI